VSVRSKNPRVVRTHHLNKWRGLHVPDAHGNIPDEYVGESENAFSHRLRQLSTRWGTERDTSNIFTGSIKQAMVNESVAGLAEGTRVWAAPLLDDPHEGIDDYTGDPVVPGLGDIDEPVNPYIPDYTSPKALYFLYDHAEDEVGATAPTGVTYRVNFFSYRWKTDPWNSGPQNQSTFPAAALPLPSPKSKTNENSLWSPSRLLPLNIPSYTTGTWWETKNYFKTVGYDPTVVSYVLDDSVLLSPRTGVAADPRDEDYTGDGMPTLAEMSAMEEKVGRKPDMLVEFNEAVTWDRRPIVGPPLRPTTSGNNPYWNIFIPADSLNWYIHPTIGKWAWREHIIFINDATGGSGYPVERFTPRWIKLINGDEYTGPRTVQPPPGSQHPFWVWKNGKRYYWDRFHERYLPWLGIRTST